MKLLLLVFAFLGFAPAFGQGNDDLLGALGTEKAKPQPVIATFKTTRVVTAHSIENLAQGVLDFRISHRFQPLKNGFDDFFGLDGATTKLMLDYGVTDGIMIGVGRSGYNREIDGYTKIKLLRQRTVGMPIALSYMGAVSLRTNNGYSADQNLSFTHQILLARKFGDRFSFQVTPTWAHYNLVPLQADPNNIFALGLGGRIRISRRVTFNAEYFPVLGDRLSGTTDALAIGFDIETGGHVFQLHFTNAPGMTERSYIGETRGKVTDGDIRFGFNISRVFTIVRPKDY